MSIAQCWGNFFSYQWLIKKLQKLEDALPETGDTGDTGEKGDTGLTGSTVLRHDLTEIKPKMGEISNS